MFLFNHKWKILPSIAFVEDKGPCLLTCSKQNGGKNLFVVHPCLCKHNFPSKRPDQICQAGIQPRLLKPVKASNYSIRFQMFHETGTFNGI